MLKLLVVDDNNRDRPVAREMSIWQDLNIQVIGEAANGHLALEQIEHLGVPGYSAYGWYPCPTWME